MKDNNFHTLSEIVKIMSSTDHKKTSQVMHEMYNEFSNFLTDEQKLEIKQAYNLQ